jgi:hypothetical protein
MVSSKMEMSRIADTSSEFTTLTGAFNVSQQSPKFIQPVTDPTVLGPVFDSFSDAYIDAIRQLESSDSASVLKFNNVVTQCMNCHSKFCPGPKKRIRQLYIK